MAEAELRLDLFLWYARVAKTRPLARAIAGGGHLRIDGRPVHRAHAPVRVGQVLTFATPRGAVRCLRVLALPSRRGPAAEAAACFEEIGEPAIDANVSHQAPGD
jgi:ribosome-associated heat shock protein Hsp15